MGANHEVDSPHIYEERITLWQAASFDQAIERAEDEAKRYAAALRRTEYLSVAQTYHLATENQPGDGDEIFALLRDCALVPDEYIARFFATGDERQG
jgi:hypothetical protein